MDAFARITVDARPGDRFAIFADPPGIRDLGAPEVWERSLARSHRRRAAAAARVIALPKAATARISAALLAAGVIGQAAPVAGAAVTVRGAAGTSDLRAGARGTAVAAAQRALGIASDGVFGPGTRRAVRSFQRAHGLVVDGRIGPQTSAALGLSGTGRAAHAADLAGPAPSTDVTRAVQVALGIAADGVFGPQTRAAVIAYQQAHGLIVDGIVGPQTRGALGIAGGSAPASGTATTTATTTSTSVAAPDAGAQAAVSAALSKVGAPYASGGNGPSAFDCSGLTSWAMRQAGISLPRTSFQQFGVGSAVSNAAIQAGDLVFFDTAGAGASDVGIATGPTTVVSATTHGVMNHAIFDGYWGSHLVGARRVA